MNSYGDMGGEDAIARTTDDPRNTREKRIFRDGMPAGIRIVPNWTRMDPHGDSPGISWLSISQPLFASTSTNGTRIEGIETHESGVPPFRCGVSQAIGASLQGR